MQSTSLGWGIPSAGEIVSEDDIVCVDGARAYTGCYTHLHNRGDIRGILGVLTGCIGVSCTSRNGVLGEQTLLKGVPQRLQDG
jgi:hypothetical protein